MALTEITWSRGLCPVTGVKLPPDPERKETAKGRPTGRRRMPNGWGQALRKYLAKLYEYERNDIFNYE